MPQESSPRRVLFLYNPKSGQGAHDVDEFVDLLTADGVFVVRRMLEHKHACSDYVKDVYEYDAVVTAGGDGTISSVAYELRFANVPMLVYPTGTANLIAQNLKLHRDPRELARVLEGMHTVKVDLAELHTDDRTIGFTLIAGAGVDAEMIRESEDLKPRLGVAAYVVGALRQVRTDPVNFRLHLDDRLVETRGMSVLIANFGMANFRMPVASGIDPADGLLSVLVLKGRTALDLIPHLLDSVRMRLHLGEPIFEGNLETYACHEVTVEADRPLPFQYDGEAQDGELPITVRILPGAVSFLTPAGHDELVT